MADKLEDLAKRFVATVEKTWDAKQRPRRALIELALAHSLKRINEAAKSDRENLKASSIQLMAALKLARSLSEVKAIILDEASRKLHFDTVVFAQLEAGRLVETAQSYVLGTVGDAEEIGSSYLEQALKSLNRENLEAFAEPLMTAAAGLKLIAKEEAVSFLSKEISKEFGDPNVTPALIRKALDGDKDAIAKFKDNLAKYAEKQALQGLASALQIDQSTLAKAIDAYEYGQEVDEKWDSATTSEKMQMVVNAAKMVSGLIAKDNKELAQVIGYAEKGVAVCAAAVAFQAASGWGAVFAGMQVAGALGGMMGSQGGTADSYQQILAAIQRVMDYLREQFARLNARLDAIEGALTRIQQAIDELKYSLDQLHDELVVVRYDIRMLQEQITTVSRLVAERYARAEEAKCITLLESMPNRLTDELVSGLAVHAQRVLNASDPLQTLEVNSTDPATMYEQLHRFSEAGLFNVHGLVPWSSLKGALQLFEAQHHQQGCPLSYPVDFNEVFAGSRDFLKLLSYLRNHDFKSSWGYTRGFPSGDAAALSLLDQMSLQVTRARAAQDYLRPLSMVDMVGRARARDWHKRVDTLKARERESKKQARLTFDALRGRQPSDSELESYCRLAQPYSRMWRQSKPLQLRLLEAIEKQVELVCAAWDKLELETACEIVLNAWENIYKFESVDFNKRWKPVVLKDVGIQCADSRGWPSDRKAPVIYHSLPHPAGLPMGLTKQWTAPGVDPLQIRLYLESSGNGNPDGGGSIDWYYFSLDVTLRLGGQSIRLNNSVPTTTPDPKPQTWPLPAGRTNVIGLPEAQLMAPFEYLPVNEQIDSTTKATIAIHTKKSAAGRQIFGEFGLAIPPQMFWDLAHAPGHQPVLSSATVPTVGYYTDQLIPGVYGKMPIALKYLLDKAANLGEGIALLENYTDPAEAEKVQAFKALAAYLTWLRDPTVLRPLMNRVLDGSYADSGGVSEGIRFALTRLFNDLKNLDDLIDTAICACAATSRSSLASNTHLRGLLQPRIVPRKDQTAEDARKYYLQQVAFFGASRLFDKERMVELAERLEARRAVDPTFTFHTFMIEGFDYFEKCMHNSWFDAIDRGRSIQIDKTFADLQQAKIDLKDSRHTSRMGRSAAVWWCPFTWW